MWKSLQKQKSCAQLFARNREIRENRGNFMKIMILGMSKHQVFLRKYLVFFKSSLPFSRAPSPFGQNGWNSPLFGVLGPKTAHLAQKRDLGATRPKPFINVTFWEFFWGPKGGKTDFGAEKAKFRAKTWFLRKIWNFKQKVEILQNCGTPPKTLPFLL